MAEIKVQPLVEYKLNKLLKAIHHIKYFGSNESAKAYVDLLIQFIYNIPNERCRKTKIATYGEWYCTYKPNKRTTYFITSDKKGNRFIVRNFFNNHSFDYVVSI